VVVPSERLAPQLADVSLSGRKMERAAGAVVNAGSDSQRAFGLGLCRMCRRWDNRCVIAGSPPSAEFESFLGTVPGMIYRTRLVPPYDDDFISAELFSVVGYPPEDFVGRDPRRRWPDLIDPDDRVRV
jgi:hypothetical protein